MTLFYNLSLRDGKRLLLFKLGTCPSLLFPLDVAGEVHQVKDSERIGGCFQTLVPHEKSRVNQLQSTFILLMVQKSCVHQLRLVVYLPLFTPVVGNGDF